MVVEAIKSPIIFYCPKVYLNPSFYTLLSSFIGLPSIYGRAIISNYFVYVLNKSMILSHQETIPKLLPIRSLSSCRAWKMELCWFVCRADSVGNPCQRMLLHWLWLQGIAPWCHLNWIFRVSVQLKIKEGGMPTAPSSSHACWKRVDLGWAETDANVLKHRGFHFPRGIKRFAGSAEMENNSSLLLQGQSVSFCSHLVFCKSRGCCIQYVTQRSGPNLPLHRIGAEPPLMRVLVGELGSRNLRQIFTDHNTDS